MTKEKEDASEKEKVVDPNKKEEEDDTTGSDEEVDESTDDESDDESDGESDDESDDDSEDEDKSKGSSKGTDLDLDAEIEKERRIADPNLAKKAFNDRKQKREGRADGDDKPLTRADLEAFEAKVRKDAQLERARELALGMAGSDKEAELLVLKWGNRTFPANMSLSEQMEETFVITHRKKLLGERNEAFRALRGKTGIKTNSAVTHHDAPTGPGGEPKLPKAEAQIMKQSGFVWNQKERRHEKKLPNGIILVRDPKTKQVRPLPRH